jgi:hypothetical protein
MLTTRCKTPSNIVPVVVLFLKSETRRRKVNRKQESKKNHLTQCRTFYQKPQRQIETIIFIRSMNVPSDSKHENGMFFRIAFLVLR